MTSRRLIRLGLAGAGALALTVALDEFLSAERRAPEAWATLAAAFAVLSVVIATWSSQRVFEHPVHVRGSTSSIRRAIGEVAERPQLGRSTIYELGRQGDLSGARVAGQWRLKRNEFAEYVKSRHGQEPGAPGEDLGRRDTRRGPSPRARRVRGGLLM